jgi:hypothetical protein
LGKVYGIKPEIQVWKNQIFNEEKILIGIEYRELDISTVVSASSKRLAWRKLAFRVHHLYTNRIITI